MDDALRLQVLQMLGGGLASNAAQAKMARPGQLNAMERSQMTSPQPETVPLQGAMSQTEFSGYGQPVDPRVKAMQAQKLSEMLRNHQMRP